MKIKTYYSYENNTSCLYLNEQTGTMCAFSRCCDKASIEMLYDFYEEQGVCSIDNFNDLLKEEYKGHERDFWENIQILHDASIYWDGNKLSQYGITQVNNLKIKYS